MQAGSTSGATPGKFMQAIVYERYGGPEQLTVSKIPRPEPAANEVLVRIHATTVNRTDCGFMRGKPWVVRIVSGLLKPRAKVLGCEFAGAVIATGDNVTGFSDGDRVVGFKDDDHDFGGHAEYTVMPDTAMLAHIPDNVSFGAAAPALEGSHYALSGIRAANVKAGQSVLVYGATGAIGSAAVQIVRSKGARVVAVCATEHVATLTSLGADRVIDYQTENFILCGEKFDLILDAVGKSSFSVCRKLLVEKGIYCSTEFGRFCQNPLLAMWTLKSTGQRVIFPIPSNLQSDATYLCGLMSDGLYTPLIDSVYPLEQIVDAYHYVETGMKTGNVVISVID